MAIIKLTSIIEIKDYETDEILSVSYNPIYINTKYISSFSQVEEGTVLETGYKTSCIVTETPEEILALIKEAENEQKSNS